MKKFLAITALLTLGISQSYAATSGTLILQGVVPNKISILVTPVAVASALNLETTQTDLKVATVNERSNSKTGYKVTISSSNLGKLKRTDGPEVVSYTMKYGGSAVGLSTSAGTVFTSTATTSVNVNKDVAISYTGTAAESMIEGTYSDTITLNIASN